MNQFEKKFMLMLEQPVDSPGTAIAEPGLGAPAGLDEPDFDATTAAVDDVEDNPGVSWRKDQNNTQRATIQEWIDKVESFIEFLNGNVPHSIQKQLASADCDTLFNNVSNNQATKITRIAAELGALQQELSGYLIKADEE